MKTLATLTMEEVNDEHAELIPVDRFDLVGAKFEANPKLCDLEIEFRDNLRSPHLFLLTNADEPTEEQKRIDFDYPLPVLLVPDATLSLRDMLEAAEDVRLPLDAILSLIKRTVRIRIERQDPWITTLALTLSFGDFTTEATCKVSDLEGFIDQEPETRKEFDARMETEDDTTD